MSKIDGLDNRINKLKGERRTEMDVVIRDNVLSGRNFFDGLPYEEAVIDIIPLLEDIAKEVGLLTYNEWESQYQQGTGSAEGEAEMSDPQGYAKFIFENSKKEA